MRKIIAEERKLDAEKQAQLEFMRETSRVKSERATFNRLVKRQNPLYRLKEAIFGADPYEGMD